MDISTAIRELAAERGMGLGAVADAAKMRRRQTFSEKLNGHSEFTISELVRISEALGLSPQSLLARAESAAGHPVPTATTALAAPTAPTAVVHPAPTPPTQPAAPQEEP